MRANQNFGTLYILLVICQIFLCNYCPLGPYIMLSILPAMVLCMPLNISTPVCMIMAFASGLAVDWLSEGILGLNAAAIVPVALVRKSFITFFLGEDLISRNDMFTFRKNGAGKISAVAVSVYALFLIELFIEILGSTTHSGVIPVAIIKGDGSAFTGLVFLEVGHFYYVSTLGTLSSHRFHLLSPFQNDTYCKPYLSIVSALACQYAS